jgi:hypothetical protein
MLDEADNDWYNERDRARDCKTFQCFKDWKELE